MSTLYQKIWGTIFVGLEKSGCTDRLCMYHGWYRLMPSCNPSTLLPNTSIATKDQGVCFSISYLAPNSLSLKSWLEIILHIISKTLLFSFVYFLSKGQKSVVLMQKWLFLFFHGHKFWGSDF